MALFPSELQPTLAEGGCLQGLTSEELDRLADEFMERAAATDLGEYARIAARYPTRPLRAMARPRRVRFHGKQREVHDRPACEDDSGLKRQTHRTWLEETWA